MRPNSLPEDARNVSTSQSCATSFDNALDSRMAWAASELRHHERIGPGICSHLDEYAERSDYSHRSIDREFETNSEANAGRERIRNEAGKVTASPRQLPLSKQKVSLPSIENSCPVNRLIIVLPTKNDFLRPRLACNCPPPPIPGIGSVLASTKYAHHKQLNGP
jgi:hypothetical protein